MSGTGSEKTYIAIDLKSFYASVECVDRGYDPLDINLVVADESRTDKTICLAVTPALKSFGVPGRPRLFEVKQKVRDINKERQRRAPGGRFTGKSCSAAELNADPSLELDFKVAGPRMSKYMDVSTRIFDIYLGHVSADDTHVYSVDEIFIDATSYLKLYKTNAHDFAMLMVRDVFRQTGITATAGIGTNMYLAKIAMDVVAKKMPPDEDGVRIAALDERSYRALLWDHRPITDFWRIGNGYARKLAKAGMYTMGDVARCSLRNEDILYKMFGVNAELLIDHAWGWEPCTIKEIKEYKTENRSVSQGQVLSRPYTFEEGMLIVKEMTELLSLDLVKKRLLTDQMVLSVGYDTTFPPGTKGGKAFFNNLETDRYGRTVPKMAHGSINLNGFTSSEKEMADAVKELYESIVSKDLYVRRMYVVANHVIPEGRQEEKKEVQMDMFSLISGSEKEEALQEDRKETRAQQDAMIAIRERFGKNAIFKGMDMQDAATLRERNAQVGGHKA